MDDGIRETTSYAGDPPSVFANTIYTQTTSVPIYQLKLRKGFLARLTLLRVKLSTISLLSSTLTLMVIYFKE